MACTPHPPPQVEAVIEIAPRSAEQPLRFRPVGRASADFINDRGDLDFSCFRHSIRVKLRIATPHVRFYQLHPLSFAWDSTQKKRPVTREYRQFKGGVLRLGPRTITFNYRNAWDCGAGDDVRTERCVKSAYGIYYVVNGRMRHADPIIGNGGGTDSY